MPQTEWFWQNPYPSGYNLNDVFILDEFTIFAVGDASTFLKSTDSGISWDCNMNIENTSHQIRSVYFLNQLNGFAVAYDNSGDLYNGWLFKTTDGGNEWIVQTYNYPLYKIFFIDDNNGWIVGNVFGIPYQGQILRTTASGNSWYPSD